MSAVEVISFLVIIAAPVCDQTVTEDWKEYMKQRLIFRLFHVKIKLSEGFSSRKPLMKTTKTV